LKIIKSLTSNRRWQGQSGTGEVSQAIAELTIATASRCLMGKEIRAQLSETVADLYCDLDKGFTPLNFLFPYLPLPSYRRRDEAHIKMRDLFLRIMKSRRSNEDMSNNDMLQALMDSEYRDGNKMTDREVACLMIALLMAGQHTSSTTGTWCLSYLADQPKLIERLIEEHKKVLGENMEEPLTYEAMREMPLLDNCIRETLRLRPPIITLIRKVS
jgi:sterol 14-demethylase